MEKKRSEKSRIERQGYYSFFAGGPKVSKEEYEKGINASIDAYVKKQEGKKKEKKRNRKKKPVKKKANEKVDRMRLNAAFATFQRGEPFAVTKQRVDKAKGFVDNSPEGTSLQYLQQFHDAEDPRDLFQHFPDGFHTPALKQPKHETFLLNDPRKQAVASAMYPDQKRNRDLSVETVEQFLDRVEGRKHGIRKRKR